MNKYITLVLLFAAAAVSACDKNGRQNITEPATGAAVKFFNFGVGTPGVYFYANDQKVTAVSSGTCQPPNDTTAVCTTTGNDSTVGTPYGSAGSGALYNQVAPGQYTLTGNIAATSGTHTPIATTTASLADGTFYSYYVSGIYNSTTKTADAFIVEDPIPTITDFSQTYVRFVNAISNSQPMTLYAKLQSTGNEVAVGGAVAYKSAGAFTALTGGVYDLNTRTAGSSTNLITRLSVSFVAGHVYTITARGDMTATITANKPALDNTANR